MEEKDKRAREALRIYRPRKEQLPFHESKSAERLIRGGKRSGKTVCAAAEFASAVTGMPIVRPDGKEIHRHYPKDNMLCWVIGWDLAHIGQTLHRYLFDPGYFKCIKDEITGEWRTFNPADPKDRARREDARPCEPFIPERMIVPKSWSWENRAGSVFSEVKVKNVWGGITKICAFPSTGMQAKQGDAVDLIWIDEDIRWSKHVSEWQDRLADRKGRLMWSAWPHGSNDALVELAQRAHEQEEIDEPDVMEIVLRFSDNPFIDDDEKRKSWGRMRTDDERRSRDFGEFLLDTIQMYEFIPAIHGIEAVTRKEIEACDMMGASDQYDKITREWSQKGEFSQEWTRYLVIDPSHTRTGVLFFVVPPPEEYGTLVIVEDELVVKKAYSDTVARAISDRIGGKQYEAFIMDSAVGVQTNVGADKTVMEKYSESFKEYKIKSRLTGYQFFPGSKDRIGRYESVRTWLHSTTRAPRLRFVMDKIPETEREFRNYRKKMIMDQVIDEPARPRDYDLMACLEYACAYFDSCTTIYTPYELARTIKGSPAYRKAMKLLSKHKGKEQNHCHIGPGGTATL